MARESSQGLHFCFPHFDKARAYTTGRMIWRVSAVRSIQSSLFSVGKKPNVNRFVLTGMHTHVSMRCAVMTCNLSRKTSSKICPSAPVG
eukprot:9343381-Pyramimonas_sp.AAC.1